MTHSFPNVVGVKQKMSETGKQLMIYESMAPIYRELVKSSNSS